MRKEIKMLDSPVELRIRIYDAATAIQEIKMNSKDDQRITGIVSDAVGVRPSQDKTVPCPHVEPAGRRFHPPRSLQHSPQIIVERHRAGLLTCPSGPPLDIP